MKLVIIEGVGKIPAIKKYLGADYEIIASFGHVRDLPLKGNGIDYKSMQPIYEILPDKVKIVKELIAKSKKAERVYLATDPDREGEAISWHLAYLLGIDNQTDCRIEYNEITKSAILNALEHPRAINLDLVNAQQTRRMLDRIVGYNLSPFLCKKIQPKLSAGRVQSVTLELVVDREREIINFKPEEYWNMFAYLNREYPASEQEKIVFKSTLYGCEGKKFKIKSKEEVDNVLKDIDGAKYIVDDVKKGDSYSKPSAPYITSTMQQDALNKLGMSLKKTTAVAQMLYEGVDIKGEGTTALVTYIRTDSTRVAPEAQAAAKAYIIKNFGENYYPAKTNFYASKKGAQDAHEAIRPTNIERTPQSIKDKVAPDVYRLYKMVYERFLASQMSPAKFYSITAEISANGAKKYNFKATGRTMVFAGFMEVYKAYSEEEENNDKLPNLDNGDSLLLSELKYEQKFTKPPVRYTEASLVKEMEDKGIGRPATYTPTVTILSTRNYIEKEGKFLKPTELGFKVTDLLIQNFKDVMNITFTASMENKLDEIEDGKIDWHDLVERFWEGFSKQIQKAGVNAKSMKEVIETKEICEKCGKPMVIREGQFGKFVACSNYPTCKHILKNVKIDEDNNIIKVEPKEQAPVRESDVKCDKCGATMVIKTGKYGEFLACPNYPKCKNIVNIDKDDEKLVCPKCGKPVVKRFTKAKKMFYGCSGYPNCDFSSWDKPVSQEKKGE